MQEAAHAPDPLTEYRESLLRARARSQDLRVQSELTFDRSILVVSGGGLAVSASLYGALIESGTPLSHAAFSVCWVAFALVLVCVILSYLATSKACEVEYAILDARLQGRAQRREHNAWDVAVRWMNRSSAALLVVAVGALVVALVLAGRPTAVAPNTGGGDRGAQQDPRPTKPPTAPRPASPQPKPAK